MCCLHFSRRLLTRVPLKWHVIIKSKQWLYLVPGLPYIRINVHSSRLRVGPYCSTRGRHVFNEHHPFIFLRWICVAILMKSNYLIKTELLEYIISISSCLEYWKTTSTAPTCHYKTQQMIGRLRVSFKACRRSGNQTTYFWEEFQWKFVSRTNL